MKLNQLPTSVQQEVKSTLCAYSKVSVDQKKDGSYFVRTYSSVHCGEYNKFIADFTAEEVFTDEERILNYVRTFKDYPFCVNGITYSGKKDYRKLTSNSWNDVEMVNGNIVFI